MQQYLSIIFTRNRRLKFLVMNNNQDILFFLLKVNLHNILPQKNIMDS